MESLEQIFGKASNIITCVGAGISTSCGLPDFRSKDKGLYNNLDLNELGLPAPELLFDLEYFHLDPAPFYRFLPSLLTNSHVPSSSSSSSEESESHRSDSSSNPSSSHAPSVGDDDMEDVTTYSVGVEPSPCHHFLSWLHSRGVLRRLYTLNIDGLEQVAFSHTTTHSQSPTESDQSAATLLTGRDGLPVIVECHGNLRVFTCCKCGARPALANLLGASRCEDRNSYCLGSVFYCNATVTHLSENTSSCHRAVENSRPRRKASCVTSLDGRADCTQPKNGYFSGVCNGVLKPNILFFGECFDVEAVSVPIRGRRSMLQGVSKCSEVVRKKAKSVLNVAKLIPRDIVAADCIVIIGMSFKVVSCMHDILSQNCRRYGRRRPVVYVNNQMPSSETMRSLEKYVGQRVHDHEPETSAKRSKQHKRSRKPGTTVINFDQDGLVTSVQECPRSSESNAWLPIFDLILLGDADKITATLQGIILKSTGGEQKQPM